MSAIFYVAIGSNLPDRNGRTPIELCRWAVRTLAGLAGWHIEALSAWYRTAPVPAADQPDFINGVAGFAVPQPDPDALLAALHAVEHRAGRVRTMPNAARPLDLDLLAVADAVRLGPGLVLPHPRLHERAFVLEPFAEIAPGWRHPLLGRTAAELCAELSRQRIERLPPMPEDLLLRARLLT